MKHLGEIMVRKIVSWHPVILEFITFMLDAVYTAGKLSIYGKFGWLVNYMIISR